MTRWIVFEPPMETAPAKPTPGKSRELVFVRDAFSVLGLLFPAFWLLFHRLWLAGILALSATVGLTVLGQDRDLGAIPVAASLALGLLVAFEGPSLRAGKLRRRGWREAAAFEAEDLREAELVYFSRARLGSASAAPAYASRLAPWARTPRAEDGR